jgi:luciferase family oxidoreductase group 1
MRPDDALWATLELAPRLEALGYSRYWLAEHHIPTVAHSSPEILLPVLAGVTERLRVGTAGVLLGYYSPFKVASDFRLLNTLFPDRIDLGIARAGVHPEIEQLLLEGAAAPPFESKVQELLGYLRGAGATSVNPVGTAPPEIWMMGKKTTSMELAAAAGTAFCLSLFIGHPDPESPRYLEEYRARFVPSPELSTPRCAVALAGVCAETEERAKRIVESYGPTVAATLVGTPDRFARELRALGELYGTDEFIYIDLCQTLPDRIRAHELIAGALGLEPPAAGRPPVSP